MNFSYFRRDNTFFRYSLLLEVGSDDAVHHWTSDKPSVVKYEGRSILLRDLKKGKRKKNAVLDKFISSSSQILHIRFPLLIMTFCALRMKIGLCPWKEIIFSASVKRGFSVLFIFSFKFKKFDLAYFFDKFNVHQQLLDDLAEGNV